MREGNRSGVSGGASLHGPMRRPRGVGRGLRWIVCSVIAGQWPVSPCVWASHTQGSYWLFERGERVVDALAGCAP